MFQKRIVESGLVVGFVLVIAAMWLIFPIPADRLTPAFAESEPPSEVAPAGEVTERAVPGITAPRQGIGLPTGPSVVPGSQPALPLAAPQTLPFKGSTPGCPPPAVTGLGAGIDAANELMACPWVGLSRQRVQDSERNIRESLEGKRLAHGGANLSLKGNSLAQWDFFLKMTNVGANLDFSAPPGFRSASLNGFTLEAPLGRAWEIALRGQIEGRAKVEVGGDKVFSWSPSLFPFGIRISNRTRPCKRSAKRDEAASPAASRSA